MLALKISCKFFSVNGAHCHLSLLTSAVLSFPRQDRIDSYRLRTGLGPPPPYIPISPYATYISS